MADRTSTAMTTVAPAYLAELAAKDKSLENVKDHRVLSRLKVVQALSKKEIRDKFPVGSVILWPTGQLVAEPEQPFLLVSVFAYDEWIVWNDRRDSANESIVERSFDRTSSVAMRAKDKRRREEKYEGGPADKPFIRRWTEVITFPSVIHGDHPLSRTPCTLTFSKGEHFTGETFVTAVGSRRLEGGLVAPLCSQVWQFCSAERDRNGNQWWGLDFDAPDEGMSPYVSEADLPAFAALNAEMAELYAKQAITVDFSDADEEKGLTEEELD